jgi:myosin heavy subunit
VVENTFNELKHKDAEIIIKDNNLQTEPIDTMTSNSLINSVSETKVEQCNQRVIELEKHNRDLEEQIQKLKKELKSVKNNNRKERVKLKKESSQNIKALTQKQKELETRIKEMGVENKNSQTLMQELNNLKQTSFENLKKAQELNQLLQEKYKQCEQKNSAMEQHTRKISSDLDNIKKEKQLVDIQNSILQERNRKIELEYNEYRMKQNPSLSVMRVGTSETTIETITKRFADLRDQTINNLSDYIAISSNLEEKLIRQQLKEIAFSSIFTGTITIVNEETTDDSNSIMLKLNSNLQIAVAKQVLTDSNLEKKLQDIIIQNVVKKCGLNLMDKNNSCAKELQEKIISFAKEVTQLQTQMLCIQPALVFFNAQKGDIINEERYNVRVSGDSSKVTRCVNHGICTIDNVVIVKAEVSTR